MTENALRVDLIRENVRIHSLGGESIATSYGANCTAVAGQESVLLVDPLIAPTYARRIEGAVASWTPLPIRFVVLTHHHTDHTLGAGYFASRGVRVLAHTACRDHMEAEHANLIESRRRQPEIAELFREAEAYLPTVFFEDEMTLDLGATEARVLHTGPGHTPGDAVVDLRAESLVVCGDLVSSGYHVNYEDATVENLESGLEWLRSLGARTYVPVTARRVIRRCSTPSFAITGPSGTLRSRRRKNPNASRGYAEFFRGSCSKKFSQPGSEPIRRADKAVWRFRFF